MSSYQEAEIRRLKRELTALRLQCPKCGGNSECVRGADFRFSSCGSPQLRRCLRCGHHFDYDDGCTG